MVKWYLYIDYGSGYTLIDPYDLSTNIAWRVDNNINPGVKRKNISGSFKLLGTEATTAYAHFVTNGNDEAAFRVYENGILGSGTLEYQGFVNITAEYNIRESIVTFSAFKTDDDYEPILAVWNDDTTIVESLSLSGDFRRFYSQGQHVNCSKLQAYSGTTWATTGNALSLGDVGRIAMDNTGSAVTIYDNLTKHLHRYIYSAPNWSLSSVGTILDLGTAIGNLLGNAAIAAISSNQIAFVEDGYNQLSFLTTTTGTWTINNTYDIEDISKPSVAFLDSVSGYIAILDNGSKVLRAYITSTGLQIGNTLSLGDLENPDICTLDAANGNIALVDIKTNTLRVYNFDGTDFTEVGTPKKLGTMYEPKMTIESVNNITIIDVIGGFMARYAFSGSAWTQTGSNTTTTGGYMGACGYDNTVMGAVQSDCLALQTSRTASYYELTNAVLSDLSLGLTLSTSGSIIDLEHIYFGEMDNLSEINSNPTPINYYKWKLRDLLQIPEIFQHYWYVDGSNIKFQTPNNFSSSGTNFDISSVQRGSLYVKTENNQESYQEGFNIAKEKLQFNNERNSEFVGLPIDYGRDNENEIIYPFSYTTDFEFIIGYFTNQTQNLNLSGLFMAYMFLDTDSGYYVQSDTGVIGSADTRNNYLSKSQIMESFWKDYRLSANRNFTLNGNSVSPQDTVRDIIRYTTLTLDYNDLGITSFPASVGNLTWDTGKDAYIYNFSVNMDSRIVTLETGILDL